MNNYFFDEQDAFAQLSERIAELNRILDSMTWGSSGVHATQSPSINYDSFGSPYSTDWGWSNFESEQDVGNFYSQYNYPSADFDYPRWQNQSNFEWQQEQTPQWGAVEYPFGYQEQFQPLHQWQEEENPSIEDRIMQHVINSETFLQQQQAYMESLTIQEEQVVSVVSSESQEFLPSEIENNLEQESIDYFDDVEVTVESEVNDVVERSVPIEDFVQSSQSTEITSIPIDVGAESEVHDFTEQENKSDTKPQPQPKKKTKSKCEPNKKRNCRRKKGKWTNRKSSDDHLRLCRRGLLFKAQRLRRKTFNTRWRPFT